MRAAEWVIATGAAALVWASGAWGAGYAELQAKAEASFAEAARLGRKLIAPEAPGRLYAPTAADRSRGCVRFFPPIHEPFADRPPAAGEVREAIELTLAPGETESCLVAVHALTEARGLAWSAQGPTPTGIDFEFLPVVMAPMAQRRSDKYRVVGMWLADGGAVDVQANHSHAWLFRVSAGEAIKPGSYAIGRSLVGEGKGSGVEVTVRLVRSIDSVIS